LNGAAGGGEGRISADDSAVQVWVVPTDEERMIARHTRRLLADAARPATVPA
jgi:acetate kinase